MIFEILEIIIYIVGVVVWFIYWHYLIGFDWLKKERLLHITFWGGTFVLLMNALLTFFSTVPEYSVELGIYSYVERNGITIAGLTLGIAVFVVISFKTLVDILERPEAIKFLKLCFFSFLLIVIGVLPLYWVPQEFGWLTTLRHLKTILMIYAAFTLGSGIIVFLHIMKDTLKEMTRKAKTVKTDESDSEE
jgi:predicted small secreted protein